MGNYFFVEHYLFESVLILTEYILTFLTFFLFILEQSSLSRLYFVARPIILKCSLLSRSGFELPWVMHATISRSLLHNMLWCVHHREKARDAWSLRNGEWWMPFRLEDTPLSICVILCTYVLFLFFQYLHHLFPFIHQIDFLARNK